jgi:nucleoside-diphosphate kinase
MIEKTFVMIKPNAVEAGLIGQIISFYERARMSVVAIKMKRLTKKEAKLFYSDHLEKSFFQELVDFISSGHVILLVLKGDNAVSVVRKLNGATNPAEADPGTIRHSFGSFIGENIVHSSDNKKSAKKEISFWFRKEEIFSSKKSYPDFRVTL